MTIHASGTFDVKLTPQAGDNPAGRLLIEKDIPGRSRNN